MTTFATFVTMRVRNGGNIQQFAWQSYEPGYNYVAGGVGYTFRPFTISDIVEASSGSAASMQVQLPLSSESLKLLEDGLYVQGPWRVDVNVYQFTPSGAGLLSTSTSAKTLLASFFGEMVGGSVDETSVTIELGNRVDAVEVQIPARVFSRNLTGRPPKL